MVEQWSPNISYRNYFDICAPKQCDYRQIQSARIIDVIIILISLYGGLSIVLRLIIPQVMKIFFKRTLVVQMNPSTGRYSVIEDLKTLTIVLPVNRATYIIVHTHSKHVFKHHQIHLDQNHQLEYLSITIIR
jgi:uncharacterized membrane protein